ncbi:hypothetical protein [Geosporobacter ferrireducens]|uniref:Uncharacterized protein n=1 Tax=Geosporobacter ferrireducens TaxID=1424294 RepID=A0A1D8GGV7_9FIRM|nr:hypothetical protein [Geosporobacter ferrireducens]AOT70116.1 hypothetical protein Gferi_11250 [Geosporobacter ferrireducens]
MDNIINKIVSLDQRAWEIKNSTDQKLKENEQSIKETLSKMEKEAVQQAREIGKEKYDQCIKKGQEQEKYISEDTDAVCKRLDERFSQIHSVLVEEVFSQIMDLG